MRNLKFSLKGREKNRHDCINSRNFFGYLGLRVQVGVVILPAEAVETGVAAWETGGNPGQLGMDDAEGAAAGWGVITGGIAETYQNKKCYIRYSLYPIALHPVWVVFMSKGTH